LAASNNSNAKSGVIRVRGILTSTPERS
jgi:hypothetical protein